MTPVTRWIHPSIALACLATLSLQACDSEPASSSEGTSTGTPTGNAGGSGSNTNPGGGAATTGATGATVGGLGNTGGKGATGTAGGSVGGEGPTPGRKTLTANNVMTTCDSPGLAVTTQRIEAECAFGATIGNCQGSTGGQQGAQTENGGTTVGFIEAGDVLWYGGVAMDGITTLRLQYAKGTEGGQVEARLDSATGTLIGTLTPAPTGGWSTWKEGTTSLKASTGKHALYLVATGATGGILNLDWLELSAGTGSSTGAGASTIRINHLGFDSFGGKHAVAEGPANLTRFTVVDASGAAAWCGDLKPTAFTAWGSNQTHYSVDFTELTKPGTYRVQIGSSASAAFEISDSRLFAKTFPSVLGYFKSSRADDSDVWGQDSSVPVTGGGGKIDARGGWYDASGDISKYLSHLSYANYLNPQQIPLVAWALAWTYEQGATALAESGQAAAVQAEALWGADYLLRVLAPTGFFYINVFDGWTGTVGARQVCAFEGSAGKITSEYQSALREGGGMSIAALARAARLKTKGEFTSDQYLAGAEKAFLHLNANGVDYTDNGAENVIDDYTGLLAAVELYDTTKTATYLEAARKRMTSLVGRLSTEGYFIADGKSRPFWHASDAGLPVVALARYVQVETDADAAASAKEAIATHLDYLSRVTRAVANPYGYARQHVAAGSAGFFIPHTNETGYWWQGENARLASLAAAALIGAEVLGASESQYLDWLTYAGYQLDWILGVNPYDICFVHGFGKNNPPEYSGVKPQNGTWKGGIANGITGSAADGSGIQWMGASAETPWENWRWVEQWLPHSAWYMVAVTALSRQ